MTDYSDERSTHPGGRNPKRPRLQPPQGRGRRRQRPTSESSPRYVSAEVPNNSDAQTVPGVASRVDLANQGEDDPSIVARYKAWRRAGNPHDSACFECKESGDLDHCETCRRSYHQECKPNGSSYANLDGIRCWYCPVCVGRRWHLASPSLTPPASPKAVSAPEDAHQSRSPVYSTSTRNITPVHPELELGIQRGNNLRAAAASTPSGSDASNRPPWGPLITGLEAGSVSHSGTTFPANPGTHGGHLMPVPNSTGQSTRGKAPRKSRYSTLSKDVDSALWVLHCELEHTPLLRQKISELETEVSGLRQEIHMRRNELALVQSVVEKSRAAEAEVDRLRAEIIRKRNEAEETEILRTINQELESKLAESRREVEVTKQTLQDWKQKLSSMLGDSFI